METILPKTVSAILLLSFAFLNVDGQVVPCVMFPMTSLNPNFSHLNNFNLLPERPLNKGDGLTNWLHGWPIAGLVRSGHYPTGLSGRLSGSSRWPIDHASWQYLNVFALLLDAALVIVVTCDTYRSVSAIVAKRFRISISSLLIAAFIAAILVTQRAYLLDSQHYRSETVALLIASPFIMLTLIRSALKLTQLPVYELRRWSSNIDAGNKVEQHH